MKTLMALTIACFVMSVVVYSLLTAWCLWRDPKLHLWPSVTRCRLCGQRVWAWQPHERRAFGVTLDNPQRVAVSVGMSGIVHTACKGTPTAAVSVSLGGGKLRMGTPELGVKEQIDVETPRTTELTAGVPEAIIGHPNNKDRTMKITLAQTNTTPRDIAGNLAQIRWGIETAIKDGSDCVVFPELSIPGYGVKDCIYDDQFVDANLAALEEVKKISECTGNTGIYIVVGYIDHNRTGLPGKPYFNCAAVIKNGITVGVYRKHLLPFYDVFDEGRYYEPGRELLVWTMGGKKWGLIICEDGWNDKGQDDYLYDDNPLAQYRRMGIRNIISVNSSPCVTGKPAARLQMFSENSKEGGQTIVYVNQIGAQDELVFDGNSFVVVDGTVVCLVTDNERTSYTTCNVDVNPLTDTVKVLDASAAAWKHVSHQNYWRDLHDLLVTGTRDYARKCGFKRAVFGSSGGIDSAVVAYFAKMAVGAENCFGIRMPSCYSSQGSKDDALTLHRNLGIRDVLIPINHVPFCDGIGKAMKEQLGSDCWEALMATLNPVVDENDQPRDRGKTVMQISNAFGMLPLTTGNKSELALGYCTLIGDMSGTWNPIGDCYKMEVYGVARYINEKEGREVIPQAIIDKAPSAELKPDQKDTDSLLPYPLLDPIIMAYVEDYVTCFREYRRWINTDLSAGRAGFLRNEDCLLVSAWSKTQQAESDYYRMVNKIDWSEFKRRLAAMCPKVHRVAFGTGRRLPVVKGCL